MIPVKLIIGYTGELNARHPAIDISRYRQKWPDAYPAIQVKRPGEDQIYFANTTMVGDTLIWNVSAADAEIAGEGSCQLVFVNPDGTVVGKTPIITTLIDESMTGYEGEIPDPAKGWVTEVLAAAADIHESAEAAGRSATDAIAAMGVAEGKAAEATRAAEQARASEIQSGKSADQAAGSVADAKKYAEQAEQHAAAYTSFHFEIDGRGHLLYVTDDQEA